MTRPFTQRLSLATEDSLGRCWCLSSSFPSLLCYCYPSGTGQRDVLLQKYTNCCMHSTLLSVFSVAMQNSTDCIVPFTLFSWLPPLEETNVCDAVCKLYYLHTTTKELTLQLQENSSVRAMVEMKIVNLTPLLLPKSLGTVYSVAHFSFYISRLYSSHGTPV